MDPRRWPEWFCETGPAVFPSFCPSVLPSVRVYSWNCIISFFLNFGTVLEIYMKLCVTEADFPEKNFLLRKLGKWTKNGPKTGFFEFIEKFCHYLLLTLPYDEIYFICCISAQIPYLGKFLFLRYGPKCSQAIRLQDFSINHISRANQWNSVIFCMFIRIYIN